METKPDFSNSAYLFPPINREGFRFGGIALAVAAGAALLSIWVPFVGCLVAPLLILAYGVFLFFRDPERYPPEDPKALLSPADGRICLLQKAALPAELETGDSREYWRVSVFMSVFNVHVNRIPYAGKVVKRAYVPGKFLNASLDKASEDNERCSWLIETAGGARYAVTQIAGLVAKRIVPLAEEGAELSTAERFGLIRFGSRLDVYLPEGMEPVVRVGQTMTAGETILGRFA